MQTRRELIRSGFVLLTMIPLAHCGSSNSPPAQNCNGVGSTSTNNAGHTHTLCVPSTDLSSPPTAGATYTSSANGVGPHTHSVALSQAQLAQIESGASVTVTSTNVYQHTHDFAIQKA